MNGWKGFFRGVLTVIVAVVSLGLYLLLRKPPARGRPGGATAKIAADAQRKIAETRKDIARDTDAELAARFNRLAKKEKKE